MQIVKQNGTRQAFLPNKVYTRIKREAKGLNVDVEAIFKECIQGIVDGMSTKDVDELIALSAANKVVDSFDYSKLASRIILTRQGKIIGKNPTETDYLYDFFGISSFLHKYSLRDDEGNPNELPHMMYGRVADHLWGNDNLKERKALYDALSNQKISLATPILINSGTNRGSKISCEITTLQDDSKEGILETLGMISKASSGGAGIGLHIHNLRSKHTLVSSFKGKAGGVTRFADMVQGHMRFFKQGKRSGAAALYLGMWHRDIGDFLNLRIPTMDPVNGTPDLFTSVCIPDIFMEKLIAGDDDWYLFCPHQVLMAGETPLYHFHGDEFKAQYNKLVELGLGYKVSLKNLWFKMMRSQSEAGVPYIYFWDNANRNYQQRHLGVATGSNLCVTGDTLLLTDKGNIPIKELVGEEVMVWNGQRFSKAPVFQTSPMDDIYRVHLSDGTYLDCTREHKWYVLKEGKVIKVDTQELKKGDNIAPFILPKQSEAQKLAVDYVIFLKEAPTYCVNEPELHKATFNNILTGNCSEYLGKSEPNSSSQCCLGLINLANVDKDEIPYYTEILVKTLNRVIDKNIWSHEWAENGGKSQRTIGLGVAGLADYMHRNKLPFVGENAVNINRDIFRTMYKAALDTSHKYAIQNGIVFDSWEDSPYAKGGYQGDIEFKDLKVANSLLISPMPSASTSVLLGVNECFEPYYSNVYVRKVDVAEFVVVNRWLVSELSELGLWSEDMKNKILNESGSVKNISEIPEDIRLRYRTVWEYSQKDMIDLAAARQEYIDQSQSFNVYYADPSYGKMGATIKYAWEKGLKTIYYSRTRNKLGKAKRLSSGTESKTSTTYDNGYEISCFGCSS